MKKRKLINLLFITVISSTIVCVCNCTAYFNTFYNGEQAFKEAQKRHHQLMEDYPDSLVVAAPADVILKYDRAIDKANKTIETFEKKKKWHDDALFLMGRSYFYKKEFEKAIRRLRQLEKEFPSSPLIPEALVYIGKAYIEDGNLDKAEEVLISAARRFPKLNDNQQITLLMITIALRRNGKSQAIALLEETMKTIRSDDKRLDLYLRTAELYIDLKQYEKAIMLLKKAPRKKNLPLQSYRVDKALLICYKSIDSLILARDLINVMITNKNYSPFMDEMLYHKGTLLYTLGETEEAIKVFRTLTAGLDSSSILSDTSSFKAKALYELAIIFQKQKEDYGKSYQYLQLAATTRDTMVNRHAKKRMSAMERLQKLRDGTDKTDSISGGTLFAIGELFRFELDEPDSALAEFMRLSQDSTTDTALLPKALIQAALIARDDLHDQHLSDSIFSLIIASYPATEYAKIAQHEAGMTVTVTTRQDSATERYRFAEQLLYIDNDVKGAIQQFFDISKIYPEQPIAPKSLFAAAWFSSTVLHKNRTAKMLYEKICEKYPESIYCTQQAKPRIKVVIDTLAKLDQLRRENEKKRKGTQKNTIDFKKVTTDTTVSKYDLDETINEDEAGTDLSITDDQKDTTVSTATIPDTAQVPAKETKPEENPDRQLPAVQ